MGGGVIITFMHVTKDLKIYKRRSGNLKKALDVSTMTFFNSAHESSVVLNSG